MRYIVDLSGMILEIYRWRIIRFWAFHLLINDEYESSRKKQSKKEVADMKESIDDIKAELAIEMEEKQKNRLEMDERMRRNSPEWKEGGIWDRKGGLGSQLW